MARAIELARNGKGRVSPNPMVGCVIVSNDTIIGEGWHQRYGEGHAEVQAVRSVRDRRQLKGSEVFVSLEPCAHHGKTPPCSQMLVNEGVGKVYAAMKDPFPEVNGKGIGILKDGGVQVECGILEQEARHLNRRFITSVTKKRPYIILKWARTSDNFMARVDYSSKWISNSASRQLVHKWRAEEDSIMVGANTVIYDDPRLNVRDWRGQDPVRICFDRDLSLDPGKQIFSREQKTICFTESTSAGGNPIYEQVTDIRDLKEILNRIHERGIRSVLVEGGAGLLKAFIKHSLWDEARVFISPQEFGSGIQAPALKSEFSQRSVIFGDILDIYYNENEWQRT